MNRKDAEYFKNEKFYNRTITLSQAIGEAIGIVIAFGSIFLLAFV